MEIDPLETQLMGVLALHDDDDVNDDDVAFATFNYIHSAHTAALALLLKGRLPEVQRCLHLCEAACRDIGMGPVATAPEEAASAAAALSTTHSAVGPLGESSEAAGLPLRPSLPPPSVDAGTVRRPTLRVLRSDEDRRVFSALVNRTAQLQKRLETARQVWPDGGTDIRPHKIGPGLRDGVGYEAMDRREAATGMRFAQIHLQQLSRAAPMSLLLPPAFVHRFRDSGAQTAAARPPPPSTHLSAPAEGHCGGPTALRLPAGILHGPRGSASQHVASTAPAAPHRAAPSPPPPPVRRSLLPLVTTGSARYPSPCRARTLPGGDWQRRPQSKSHVGTPAAEDKDAEGVDDTPALQQLSHRRGSSISPSASSPEQGSSPSSVAVTQSRPDPSRRTAQLVTRMVARGGADENEQKSVLPLHGGDIRGGNGGRAGLPPVQRLHAKGVPRTTPSLRGFTGSRHGPHPAQSPFTLEECFTPRRRVLPVPTNIHPTASSAANGIASSVPRLPSIGSGLPSDGAVSATAACTLPPLTGLETTATAASAAAARAVRVARQTVQFATASLNAQLQRSVMALEECDQWALSRLPYSAREALLAARARQAAEEDEEVSSRSSDVSPCDSPARVAAPVSVATSVTPSSYPAVAPHALSTADPSEAAATAAGAATATAAAAAILPPVSDQSEDVCVCLASAPRSAANASQPMPAFALPHPKAVATKGPTALCPFPAVEAVFGGEKVARSGGSEGGSAMIGPAETTQPVVVATSLAECAVQEAQEVDGEAAGRVGVALSTQASPQARPSGAGGAARHYTYNAAVEALVHARLAARRAAVPRLQAAAPLAAVVAEAVEESRPSTSEETLVRWRRMLQMADSTPAATTALCGAGTTAAKVSAAAAVSPFQTSRCLLTPAVAPSHSTVNGGVHRTRHGIRSATGVLRDRQTQRIVCEALRQASHVLPRDLVHPTRKVDSAACPKPSFSDLPNVFAGGVDGAGAGASAKMRGHAARHTTGEVTMDTSLLSGACTSTQASPGVVLALNGAAPSRRQPPQVSGAEVVVPWLPLSLGAASTSVSNFTVAGPSTAAVADVLRQLHDARRASAALLSIEDWTVVAPNLLGRSLPLSVRAVRIQRWWRQRLAARLCRQRRAAQEAYLLEEERRDAAALRLQQQMCVHWAQEALARCAAAYAAWTEHRVAAERTPTMRSSSTDTLAGDSIAFEASDSFTTMSPPHVRGRHPVAPYAFESTGGAFLSEQVRCARAVRITPAVAAAPDSDEDAADSGRGQCRLACCSPLKASRAAPPAAKPAAAVGSIKSATAAPLSVHNGTDSERQSAAAHRIQRCYRRHLARLHMARLRRDAEVLSAVVTRRAPLAAIRLTLTAAPLSAPAAESRMKQLPSGTLDGGAGEFSVISPPSGDTRGSPPSLLNSSTAFSHAAPAREVAKGSDAAIIRSLLNHDTGDVYEAYLQRGLAARRNGDYKTPLERVSLRDLQRIRQQREGEAARQRQQQEREQQRRLEQQQRWERQVLEASKTIQRVGRGCRWRRWLRERELKMRQRADPHEVEWLSRSIVSGLHNGEFLSSKGLPTQPVLLEDAQCAKLAGGEAVASHIISRLQEAHPQWFGVAARPTSAQYIASHCTPAQHAAVTTAGAFLAAFASRAEVFSRYRHTCARSLQLVWRLHRAKLHSRGKRGRLASASEL
ncbi:hypothetical protein LSCM1_06966 [Leishmania martiniquensis]|uniref:IQ calmodulin-binding motif family protein n=1 Tax=Leishmania martiniquensis TaxID=1580590 RepID=A0A836HKC6_9TRYP|nr:hypothetical protein LSCM1_06966 [Leishmania martiniquensis]